MAIWHAQAGKLFASGATAEEIAKRTRRPLSIIRRWMDSYEVPRPAHPIRVDPDQRTDLQRLADEGPSAAYRAARAQLEARS